MAFLVPICIWASSAVQLTTILHKMFLKLCAARLCIVYRSSEFDILHMRKKFHTNIKPSIGLKQNDSPSIVRSKTILSLSFSIFVTYHLLFNSMLCNWVSEVTLTSGGENRLLNYHTALFHNKSTFAHLSMAENIIVQKHVHHYPLPLYDSMGSKLRKI